MSFQVESRHYPSCCSSLSTTPLTTLLHLLPQKPALSLSIRSGTGLPESLLLTRSSTLKLQVVEVSKDINIYLPDEVLNIVDWTGGLCDAAGDATAWLFVYPRSNELMDRYLKALGKGAVQSIICLIPKADHEDLDALMQHHAWEKEIITESGLADYEMLIHWQKH